MDPKLLKNYRPYKNAKPVFGVRGPTPRRTANYGLLGAAILAGVFLASFAGFFLYLSS